MSDSPTILARVRLQWRMKLWLGTLLSVAFAATYLAAQRWPLREPYTLRPGAIDRLVPFDARWAWVYLSFNAIVTAAWLARSRWQLWRYSLGFTVVTLVGVIVFVAFPTQVPRPLAPETNAAYRYMVRVDRPLNCMPSQHVALATYTTLFAARVLDRRHPAIVATLAAWTLLIAYATLATKQHYFLDLPAGALLGLLGHVVAWRRAGGRRA